MKQSNTNTTSLPISSSDPTQTICSPRTKNLNPEVPHGFYPASACQEVCCEEYTMHLAHSAKAFTGFLRYARAILSINGINIENFIGLGTPIGQKELLTASLIIDLPGFIQQNIYCPFQATLISLFQRFQQSKETCRNQIMIDQSSDSFRSVPKVPLIYHISKIDIMDGRRAGVVEDLNCKLMILFAVEADRDSQQNKAELDQNLPQRKALYQEAQVGDYFQHPQQRVFYLPVRNFKKASRLIADLLQLDPMQKRISTKPTSPSVGELHIYKNQLPEARETFAFEHSQYHNNKWKILKFLMESHLLNNCSQNKALIKIVAQRKRLLNYSTLRKGKYICEALNNEGVGQIIHIG